MDRLVCGDDGFGKTEVAIRAAFAVAVNGKQTLMLAPTTILAEQHWHTFRNRYRDFPVRVEMVSRFQIGRASCRERVEISAVAVALKRKKGAVDGQSQLESSGSRPRL